MAGSGGLKTQNQRTAGSGYLKKNQNQRTIGFKYVENKKKSESKSRWLIILKNCWVS
jgi:hypothetical protein